MKTFFAILYEERYESNAYIFFAENVNSSNNEIYMDDAYIFYNYGVIFPQSFRHFQSNLLTLSKAPLTTVVKFPAFLIFIYDYSKYRTGDNYNVFPVHVICHVISKFHVIYLFNRLKSCTWTNVFMFFWILWQWFIHYRNINICHCTLSKVHIIYTTFRELTLRLSSDWLLW